MDWIHKAFERLHAMEVDMSNTRKQVDKLLNFRHAVMPGGSLSQRSRTRMDVGSKTTQSRRTATRCLR